MQRPWLVTVGVLLTLSTAIAQERPDARQDSLLLAALWTPGRELEIVPNPAKVKAAGLTVEAIREACAGRRLRHNAYRVRIDGVWVNLAKVATVRERPLATTPFGVSLPDGRQVRVTIDVNEVGKYCITSKDFEDFVRQQLKNLFVEEPGDAHVLGMLPVPGNVIPHVTTRRGFAHYSLGVPLNTVARVEVSGKAGPQIETLRRLRAARKALDESLTLYEDWSRSEFELLFGKGTAPKDTEEEGKRATRMYALGPERLQAIFEEGRVDVLLLLTADSEISDAVKAEKTYRAMLLAFLKTVYRDTGEQGRAELQRFFGDTPAIQWSADEKQPLLDVVGKPAAPSTEKWKPRAALAGTAREMRPDGIRIRGAERVDLGQEEEPTADEQIAAIKDLSHVQKVNVDLFDVTDAGLAQLAKATQLRELNLNQCDKLTVAGLAHLKGLTQLEYLTFENTAVTDDALAHLSGLTGLWVLNLNDTAVTDAGVVHLKHMSRLRELWLPRSAVTDVVLAQIKAWPELYTLNEYGEVTTAEEWAELRKKGAAAVPEGLRVSLRDSKVTDAGLRHLAGNTRLHALALADTDVTDAGLAHLKGLSELKELCLAGTHVTDAGLIHVRSKPKLEKLYLGQTQVSDAGLEHLAGLSRLGLLWLDATDITDAGLKHLTGLTRLCELSLSQTNIRGPGLEHLAKLKDLSSLDLSHTPLSDAGLASLPPLPRLTTLNLSGTYITDAGQALLKGAARGSVNLAHAKISDAAITRLKALPALATLDVHDTPISEAGVATLRQALPGVKVVTDFDLDGFGHFGQGCGRRWDGENAEATKALACLDDSRICQTYWTTRYPARN